jgi:hypothetical protein
MAHFTNDEARGVIRDAYAHVRSSLDRRAFALADLARYPLFSEEFLRFLAEAIPPARHAELVYSIVVTARKPAAMALDPLTAAHPS